MWTIFLKAVFNKFYLVHFRTLRPKYCISTTWVKKQSPTVAQLLSCEFYETFKSTPLGNCFCIRSGEAELGGIISPHPHSLNIDPMKRKFFTKLHKPNSNLYTSICLLRSVSFQEVPEGRELVGFINHFRFSG